MRRGSALASSILLLALAACSRTPAAPGSTDPAAAVNLSGTWEGQYQETRCTSASCPQCCSARFKGGTPAPRNFRLTLRQHGTTISGTFEELLPSTGSPLTGPVSGRLRRDRLDLTGSLTWRNTAWQDVFGFADLSMTEAEVGRGSETITGSFLLLDRDQHRAEFMRRTCQILSLRRMP